MKISTVQTVGVFDTDSNLTIQVKYRPPASRTIAQFMSFLHSKFSEYQ